MSSAALELPLIPPPLPTTPVPSRDASPTPLSPAAAFAAASAAAEATTPDVTAFVGTSGDASGDVEDPSAPLVGAEITNEDAAEDETKGAGASDDPTYAVPMRKPPRKEQLPHLQLPEDAPRAVALPNGDGRRRLSRFDRLGAAFSRLLDKGKDKDKDKEDRDQAFQRRSWNPQSDVNPDGELEKQSGDRSSLVAKGSNFLRRSFRAHSTAESDSTPPLSPLPLSPSSTVASREGFDAETEVEGSVSVAGSMSVSVSVAGSRASVYAEELVSALACSACAKYMQAPIEQCRQGHNVCRHCRSRAARAHHHRCPAPGCSARLAGLRNRLAEQVAARLLFPCAHAHVGCTRQVPSDELEFHEPRCPYRVYRCLISVSSGVPCPWEGRRTDLESHVREAHSRYFSEQETTKWRWAPNLFLAMHDFQLIATGGELFWYCASQDPRRMRLCWFVALVGPDTRALRHSFTFKMTSPDGRSMQLVCPTLPDYAQPDVVIEEGKCADVSYAQALSMLDEDGMLNFSITVSEIQP